MGRGGHVVRRSCMPAPSVVARRSCAAAPSQLAQCLIRVPSVAQLHRSGTVSLQLFLEQFHHGAAHGFADIHVNPYFPNTLHKQELVTDNKAA